MDQPHRPRPRPACPLPSSAFQSLLSWISLIGSLHGLADLATDPDVSILVVVDQPHRQYRRHGSDGPTRVSILVVVDQPHRPQERREVGDAGEVSILVVVDQPHRQGPPELQNASIARFQSLLSWISLIGRVARRRSDFRGFSVSILVVVDQPHRPCNTLARGGGGLGFNPCCRGSASSAWYTGTRAPSEAKCFNPCCRGSASSAPQRQRQVHCEVEVSILVVVDQPHRRVDRLQGGQLLFMFQSLLSWISLIGIVAANRFADEWSVSILVVVDQPHRPEVESEVRRQLAAFQSLLSWISLIGARPGVRRIAGGPCFNPCCRGSALSARKARTRRSPRSCFNPCCRGSASSAIARKHMAATATRFQSLLSWISLIGTSGRGRGFDRDDVSILVVVDQPHRHPEPEAADAQ